MLSMVGGDSASPSPEHPDIKASAAAARIAQAPDVSAAFGV